jgi:hypothetical protein
MPPFAPDSCASKTSTHPSVSRSSNEDANWRVRSGSMTERLVRLGSTFFDQLDRQLPHERAPVYAHLAGDGGIDVVGVEIDPVPLEPDDFGEDG